MKRRVLLLATLAVGLDTDRNPFTGGGRGDELLAFGYASRAPTLPARWSAPRSTP